jgi:hypothetical protein
MAFKLPQINFGGYYNEPEMNPIDVALKLLGHEAGLKSELSNGDLIARSLRLSRNRPQICWGCRESSLERRN